MPVPEIGPRMTGDERNALLLAARLLESGVALRGPELGDEGGHVNVALTLTDRLRRVPTDPTAPARSSRRLSRRRGRARGGLGGSPVSRAGRPP